MLGSYRSTDQADLFDGEAAVLAGSLGCKGRLAAPGAVAARAEEFRQRWDEMAAQYGRGVVEVAFWAGRARPGFRCFADGDRFARFAAAVDLAGFNLALRCI